MKTLLILIKRNTKLFFKDKALFLTALITPFILLVLYSTFLGEVYKDSFTMAIPQGVSVPEELIDGAVSAQLVSSLLAVSCVTVAFCTNMLSVADKANGAVKDLLISPISSHKLAFGYYISSLISTLAVCLGAAAISLVYVAFTGWYLSIADVFLIILDVFLITLFGVALSSVINFFLSTQGQISAVGSIVSSGYGFICGAYMPLSQFSSGLRNAVTLLPGSHATSLLRNHTLRGVFAEMQERGVPSDFTEALGDTVDCRLFLFENQIEMSTMYSVLIGTTAALILIYVLMHFIKMKRSSR